MPHSDGIQIAFVLPLHLPCALLDLGTQANAEGPNWACGYQKDVLLGHSSQILSVEKWTAKASPIELQHRCPRNGSHAGYSAEDLPLNVDVVVKLRSAS